MELLPKLDFCSISPTEPMAIQIKSSGTVEGALRFQTGAFGGQTYRCASYQRYSDDGQKRSSIDDQLRNCSDLAAQKKWTLLPQFTFNDEGISGAALASRDGLNRLLLEATKRPLPFDCVLIDDTSRLSRSLPDVLNLVEKFRYNGVFLYFVTQGLDSRDLTSRKMLTLNGIKDEDYLLDLRNKVHRGLRGAVLKGHHTGGDRYGYKSVLVEDPIRKDKHGRPEIAYSYLVIDPEEARVVKKSFDMNANGMPVTDIAKLLNSEGIPGPRGADWAYATVRRMLRNELYIGTVNWNRTQNDRDPDSRKLRPRKRPREEWAIVENSDLRIVDQDVWDRVQARNERMRKRGEKQRLGGYFRTSKSRGYLFSGRLHCGLCNRRMSIISSGTRTARYGCPAHRTEGRCSNRLTIRRDALEEQLLSAITDKLQPEVLQTALDERLQVEIQEYLDREVNQEPVETAVLEKRLAELTRKRSNVTDAIASFGPSDGLFSQLAAIESEIDEAKRKLLPRKSESSRKRISFEEFREFVMKRASDLKETLRGDPVVAREALGQVISDLILTPAETSDGPVYEVSGEHIDLLAGNCGVMHGQLGDQTAKHYTPLLSLVGVQLHPSKPAQQTVTRGDDRNVSAFPPLTGVEKVTISSEALAV
jgi:site-specific DNA recombinase